MFHFVKVTISLFFLFSFCSFLKDNILFYQFLFHLTLYTRRSAMLVYGIFFIPFTVVCAVVWTILYSIVDITIVYSIYLGLWNQSPTFPLVSGSEYFTIADML